MAGIFDSSGQAQNLRNRQMAVCMRLLARSNIDTRLAELHAADVNEPHQRDAAGAKAGPWPHAGNPSAVTAPALAAALGRLGQLTPKLWICCCTFPHQIPSSQEPAAEAPSSGCGGTMLRQGLASLVRAAWCGWE